MALFVYKIDDGSLYSWSPNDTDQVADEAILSANGMAVVLGQPPLDSTHTWDADTKTVVVTQAVTLPVNILTGKWIMRFTPQEFSAISSSNDTTVQLFMYALNHTTQINLNDPDIISGINYLVSVNLLASDRVTTILGA